MELNVACAFTTEGLDAFERAEEQADFFVLPELSDGGYERLHREEGPSPTVGNLIDRFAAFSRGQHLTLIGGTVALAHDDGSIGNSTLVFHNGETVARFDKVHLFRPLGDDQFFAAGKPRAALEIDCNSQSVRIGVIICYDLRFPELVRPWFKSGLDILFVPARWPRMRDDLWRILLQARAIENQCFVIGVDSRDDEGGGSYAFGPGGEEVFAIGPNPVTGEPLWHSFGINLDKIEEIKSRLDTRADACLL